ncbi:MAG: hypothetical protein R3C61_00860 [Bacteroidia bacterium]
MSFIHSNALRLEDVPQSDANINEISRFAITFDVSEVGEAGKNLSLDSDFSQLTLPELRCILYVEQRRWNHFNRAYDAQVEQKLRDIVSNIRASL